MPQYTLIAIFLLPISISFVYTVFKLEIMLLNCFIILLLCQLIGYDFDYDEFHASVHGKLPYEKLKPDPVLRSLLLSMPQRKIVSSSFPASKSF